MKRAQAATETIIIIAIALVIFLAVFVYNQTNISNVASAFEVTMARSAVDTIANTAELMYQQGAGAKTKVYVNFPSSIKSVSVQNQTLSLVLYGQNSDITIYRNLDFTLVGELPTSEGNQWIIIYSGGTYVSVGNESVASPTQACGNNLKEGSEQCDGPDLAGQSCTSRGYDLGILTCTSLCTFNESSCAYYLCGNNAKEGNEVCDGTALDGKTCKDLGYGSGTLGCYSDCSAYNTSDCVPPPHWSLDLWPYLPDTNYPVTFDSGLNTTGNTFWPPPTGADDGWDRRSDVYSGNSTCIYFNNNDALNDKRLELYWGNVNGQCSTTGTASAAYGIQFYVDSDVYNSTRYGRDANLSFVWSFNNSGLDTGDDVWIKATLGNGTSIALENWENRVFGSGDIAAANFQGGFGWLYEWARTGTVEVTTDRAYQGAYAARFTAIGYAERAVDISKYTNPYIEFHARPRSLEAGDLAHFKISRDGMNYTTIYTWTSAHANDVYQTYVFPLAKNTTVSGQYWIAFQLAAGANDFFYVDNIDIYEGTINYLGTQQDQAGNYKDEGNEIMWFNNPTSSFNNYVMYNVTQYIKNAGWHYLSLGVKNYKWDIGEWGEAYFDNVSLVVQK